MAKRSRRWWGRAGEAAGSPRGRAHLQVPVHDPVLVEVLDSCQDLVDHQARVFLRVNAPFQDPVKQLSPRHPVERAA